jgi:hypothetical protein
MIDLFKRKRAGAVLGLALDGNRLEVVSLRRSNGTVQIRQALAVDLALSPLTDAPELVGQEIRNHLDKAGIREKRCAVCLPLNWILTLQAQIPDLPDSERDSFLQIEAERGFHSGPETLFTANSLFKSPAGEQYATMLAAPRNNLEALQRVLRGAKLKPATFALGITALQPAGIDTGRILTLAVRSNTVDLQVTGGGGIIALRSLDGAIETQGAMKSISADLIAREIRITLGQLPAGFSQGPAKLKIFGQTEMARQLARDLAPSASILGLNIEFVDKASNAQFDKPIPPEVAVSPALALAANYVRGVDSAPDLLPPKVQPWKQLVVTRLSPRKLAWAGAALGAIALCVAGAFAVQQFKINKLESQWRSMEPTVNELTSDQDNIKKFRGWYDKSFHDILIRLWSALPEDGSVSAKTIELRDLSSVTCTGNARDDASFLKLHAKLADDTNEISGLHAEVRGQKPMQFTLNFQWEGAVQNGN